MDISRTTIADSRPASFGMTNPAQTDLRLSDDFIPAGAIAGLTRGELNALLRNPEQLNRLHYRDALLAPDNLFRYFDVLVAGEYHANNSLGRYVWHHRQVLQEPILICSESLPHGFNASDLLSIGTERNTKPGEEKEFYFGGGSVSHIPLLDEGINIKGIEVDLLVINSFIFASLGASIRREVKHVGKGESNNDYSNQAIQEKNHCLTNGLRTIKAMIDESPLFQQLELLSELQDINDCPVCKNFKLPAQLEEIKTLSMQINALLDETRRSKNNADINQIITNSKACRMLCFSLSETLSSLSVDFLRIHGAMGNQYKFSINGVDMKPNLSEQTLSLISGIKCSDRLEENGKMAQVVFEHLCTREQTGNTAAKALVLVGASHANFAVTVDDKEYPSIAEKLTQQCGVNEKLILSFFLANNKKDYAYEKMQSGSGYAFPNDILIIPMDLKYYASRPKITRRLSPSTIIQPKDEKENCSIQ